MSRIKNYIGYIIDDDIIYQKGVVTGMIAGIIAGSLLTIAALLLITFL